MNIDDVRKTVDDIRERYDYGTTSSGNWGHVGVPGMRGGSAPGGGGSFRQEKYSGKGANKKFVGYTSQAKVRDGLKESYRKAKSDKGRARIQKQMSKIDMRQKSNDKTKKDNPNYNVVKYDPHASNRIALSKERGKGVWNRSGSTYGTKENIRSTYKR